MQTMILTSVALLVGGIMVTPALAAPDGKKIAEQGQGGAPCLSCHGDKGQGNGAGGFPSLAGMNADYLARQLHSFKTGTRQSPVMAPQAMSLDEAAIKAVAAYYADLPATVNPPPITPDQEQLQRGKALATQGRWSDDIPACVQCHGPGGRGIPPHFPHLAGQHASYIEGQLNNWKNGTRRNDPNGLMAAVADRLTDVDIKAVAAWFASRPATAPSAAK